MEVFVARQPIFNRRERVYAYELLFRSGSRNAFLNGDGNQATSRVITDSIAVFGLEAISGGKPAFVNFPQDFLLNDYALVMPKEWLVVEVLETVEPEPEVVEALRRLKQHGYRLALDDFEYRPELDHLLALADLVKLDFLAVKDRDWQALLAKLKPFNVELLAEKVETQEEYRLARDLGFNYFQGYFFSKPVIVKGQDVPGFKVAYLQLLQKINAPELDIPALVNVFKKDVSLSYKLLRYINSAYFALREPVTSIHQALNLLGEDNVRKWASVVVLASLGQDKPDELVSASLVRAHFGESLAGEGALRNYRTDLFLMGLFSLLESLVGRPLAELMGQIPVREEVKSALLCNRGPLAPVHRLTQAYEKGDWDEVLAQALKLGVAQGNLPFHYLQALKATYDMPVS